MNNSNNPPCSDGPPVDAIVPVPPGVSRRAWECAFDLGQEHSCRIGSNALWYLFQSVVTQRDPRDLTWAECALLFRVHRQIRGVRA